MGKTVAPSSIVFEVLEKDNYEDWSETIQAYLEFKDLWDVVESNEQPPDRDADEAWKKKNSEALHAIKISCGRHFLSKIRRIREADKAWRTLQAYFIPHLPRMEYTFNPQQGDGDEEAYKSLAVALSRREISFAIELCKKNPALLIERLPNYTPLLHELIMLGSDLFMSYEVVELLKSDHFPKEALEMRDSLGRTSLVAAVSRIGAIRIALCLVHMNPALIHIPDDFGRTPLTVAIDSAFYTPLIDEMYSITPPSVWPMEDGKYGATVINKCIEVRKFDFASKFLKEHPYLIFAKDVNGISPLYAAARAPHIFNTPIAVSPHKFPDFIFKCQEFTSSCLNATMSIFSLWEPKLRQGLRGFALLGGIELLISMRDAIRDLNMTTGLLRDAFFEAIKCDNFNFLIMLMNADKKILEEVNDMSKNIYMCAIEYRRAKIFSLIFWEDIAQYANVREDKWKNNLLHMAATWTPPNELDRISKPAVLMIREVMWFEEVLELEPDLVTKCNVDGKIPYDLFKESHKDLMMEAEKGMKESTASWAIVGPLVITIMFAAAFQIPGGYNQEMGFPIFLNKMLFKFYMVLVSISLFSATISVVKFLEILSSNYQGKDFLSSLRTYNVITGTLFLSLTTMLVAFCLGLFLTLHGDLAIFLPIAVIFTFLVVYIVYTKFPLFVESFTIYRWRNSLFERNIGDEVKHIFEMLNRQPTEEEAIGYELC